MRLINRALAGIGRQIKIERTPKKFSAQQMHQFREQMEETRRARPKFAIIEELRDESQAHPMHYKDFECEFASEQIARVAPRTILDIGSYRTWLAGLMAHYHVTTIDVRERRSGISNETMVTQDVRVLDVPGESVDIVTSLHTIEHVGLGRYGDEFDPRGDVKAVANLLRVVRPGGYFLFSVPITAGAPCIAFNCHRIYNNEMVRDLVKDLQLVEEIYVKRKPARLCEQDELATMLGEFDVYCGCYRKKDGG